MSSRHSKNIIGSRVREARESHVPPLTQAQLSAELARKAVTIARAGIAKVELGERSVYDFEVKAFAAVLGVTVEWLMDC